MPELPEVETMCRGIAPIVGRRVESLSTPKCAFRPISIKPTVATIRRRLQAEVITGIGRLGKRVVIQTADWALVLQPKMSGMVVMDAAPDAGHIRLQLDFSGSPPLRLQFWDRRGLGTVELMPREEIGSRIVDGRLGPDALAIQLEDFSLRLSATRRPIKVALLDQKLVAGIGNLYASEMLHAAQIHPEKPCSTLSKVKVGKLYAAMQSILLTAIDHEGSTLSDGTYRNALNESGRFQNHHLVYHRANLPCLTCSRGTITRIVQSQRSTFYCPRCQK